MTARELAHATQISIPAASVTLSRLVAEGCITEVDRVRSVHMKRPAVRYGLPATHDRPAWQELDTWARFGGGAQENDR